MFRAIIIDDDQWALADMKRCFAFEKNGFQLCGEYTSAEDAWGDILIQQPDLIVSDICMKQSSGIDLARLCEEHKIDALFILVSGYDDFEYVQQAFQYRVFQYLLKPLEEEKVEPLMLRAYEHLSSVFAQSRPKNELDSVDKALKLLENRFMETNLRLEVVAEELFINKTYLSEKFSQRTGISFTNYKNEIRIRHAKAMLQEGTLAISQIAEKVGFESASYFSRLFKRMVGVSPQDYKKNYEL